MMPLADNGGTAAEGSSERDEAAMAARAQEQRVVGASVRRRQPCRA